MKKYTALLIALVVMFSSFSQPFTAEAAISDWQRGASIFPYNPTDFSSATFQQSLRNLKATGANYVALVIPIYQSNDTSSDIFAGGDTPTDASLISAINYAHSIGLKVMLKPHLGSQSGTWRATINASNRDAWFQNYGNILIKYADIAKQNGVEGMCVGTELISMATYTSNADNTQRWNSMIANVRSHFSGFLTYSANWGSGSFGEEAPHIGFWPALDMIGISAYYPLASGQTNPSVSTLVSDWNYWNDNKVKPLANQYGKKVLFTEVGYRSVDGAHNDPYEGARGGNVNLQEQVNDYQALFQFWNNSSIVAGMYIWNWESNPNAGGVNENHYTVQNKPAEAVVKQWYTQTQTPPPVPANTQFQSNGSISGTPTVGQASTITASVTSNNDVSNVLVDIEVYNASNNKVFQNFVSGQNLTAQQAKIFSVPWTPSNNENYTVKLGVFKNDWTQNYHWNNELLKVSVGQTTPPPPEPTPNPTPTTTPATSETNIWWPSNGAAVTGVQPFKAMLTNRDVSTYTMYWKVDNGQLNQMANSNVDYPHKESDVDLSGWTWKGEGPYQITFVSKDSSGATLSEKSVNILVK